MPANILDLSNELHIYQYDNGIKLLRPGQARVLKHSPLYRDTQHTLGDLLKMPFPVLIDSHDIISLACNEATADALNYSSVKECIGQPWYKNLNRVNSHKAFAEDKRVLRNNKKIISDQSFIRKDDIIFDILTIKMPVYDHDNQIAALVCCGVISNWQSPAEFLSRMIKTGLFNAINYSPATLDHQVPRLTTRQADCLKLTVRGNSAAQVAGKLGLSRRTVEEYINQAKVKFGATSKSELISMAVDFYHYQTN